jgi:hypothetical protein
MGSIIFNYFLAQVVMEDDDEGQQAAAATDRQVVVTDVAQFGGAHPEIMLRLLLAVPVVNCENGKRLYSSYGKLGWFKLNPQQKAIVKKFFDFNITAELKQELVAKAVNVQLAVQTADKDKQANTSKHDRARLLHVRKDATMQCQWSLLFRQMERSALDSSKSDGHVDAAGVIAEFFNDYERNSYDNPCVRKGVLSAEGLPIAISGLEAVFDFCSDINPSQAQRPMRDGAWVRKHFKEMKTVMSVAYANYRKSGNQEAEDYYAEIVKFCKGDEITVYGFMLFDKADLEQMGKALPENVQRDTGILGEKRTSQETASEGRQRRRLAARELVNHQTADRHHTISDSLSQGFAMANEVTALQCFFAMADTDEDKSRARERMRQLAFPATGTVTAVNSSSSSNSSGTNPHRRSSAASEENSPIHDPLDTSLQSHNTSVSSVSNSYNNTP